MARVVEYTRTGFRRLETKQEEANMKTTMAKMMKAAKVMLVGLIGFQLCLAGVPQEAEAGSFKKAFKKVTKAVTKPFQQAHTFVANTVTSAVNQVKKTVQTSVNSLTNYAKNPSTILPAINNFVKKNGMALLNGAAAVVGSAIGINPYTIKAATTLGTKISGLVKKVKGYVQNPKKLKNLKNDMGQAFLNKAFNNAGIAKLSDMKKAQSWIRQAGNAGKNYLQANQANMKKLGAMLQMKAGKPAVNKFVPVLPKSFHSVPMIKGYGNAPKIIAKGKVMPDLGSNAMKRIKIQKGFSTFAKGKGGMKPVLGFTNPTMSRPSNP